MISESKLDNSFPDGQSLTEGYSAPFRLDQNNLGGGIMLLVRIHIPAKLLSLSIGFESFFCWIKCLKKKWLLSCSYNPEGSYIESHLNYLFKSIDALSSSMRT